MTKYDGKTIELDSSDYKGMIELMKRADEFDSACSGKNKNGENVLISVNHDNITVETFQNNGWIRKNVYWECGMSEELYER